jgi:hypothetical protein
MIDRIHRDPSDKWSPAFPPVPSRFPYGNILMLKVSDLPDCSPAFKMDLPQLAGRQPHLRIVTFL